MSQDNLTYVTEKAGIVVTAANPKLRTWLMLSMMAGKPQGMAPKGTLTATGSGLGAKTVTDYGEVLFPVILAAENNAGSNGHSKEGDVMLVLRQEKGWINAYLNGKQRQNTLGLRLDKPTRPGLQDYAKAIAELLKVDPSAMLNGQEPEFQVKRLHLKVDPESMMLTGGAKCTGAMRWEIRPENNYDAEPLAHGKGEAAEYNFVCIYDQPYQVEFFGEGDENRAKGMFTPVERPAKEAKVDTAEAAPEAKLKVTKINATKKNDKVEITASCSTGTVRWEIVPDELVRSVAGSDGAEIKAEFESKHNVFVLTLFNEEGNGFSYKLAFDADGNLAPAK